MAKDNEKNLIRKWLHQDIDKLDPVELGEVYKFTRTLIAELNVKRKQEINEYEQLLSILNTATDDLRCVEYDEGGGDKSVGWEVVAHHSTDPKLRTVGKGQTALMALRDAYVMVGL